MPKIPLNNLQPGMMITRQVLNESGMVLLSENTELTEATIEKLKKMNVEGVYVKGLSKPERPKEEVLLELYKRFEKVEHEPYMDVLKKVLKEHIEGLYE
ncbi:MAG: hypothetical protein NT010_14250 [Proteobacteria bacterium]|nr:hypothetical protein [Pseudomonadota bacterium]